MNFFSLFWKGMLISVSQLVPGVSGSTIAMILGIYDRLIEAVNHIWDRFRENFKILSILLLGAATGIIVFARGIQYLLETYPIPLGIFFVGVVLGGVPLMYRKSAEKGIKLTDWIYFIAGLAIVLVMTMELENTNEVIREWSLWNAIYLFIGGIIFAIALVLPGISGSFMLLVIGLYQTMIVAASEVNLVVLGPIGLGAIAGTLLTARVIEWLLDKYQTQSYLMILGFILGSVLEIFPGWPQSLVGWIVSAVVFVAGFVFVWKTSEMN